ncbi:AraD1 family protein [Salinisphaera hydrothermalis]|uniref:AraD1 family protein n=1 Tax=Salinisphaera hydrothermalis TaxID=563188 RepID=UPI00333F36F0
MQLIQYETAAGQRRVGIVDADRVTTIADTSTVRELALAAIHAGRGLAAEAEARGMADGIESLDALLAAGRVLPPLDHDDPAHCLITGTGLTHTGSADTRNAMHQAGQSQPDPDKLTDSMKVFNWGLEGGRPAPGQPGVQPEWFYKGDGRIVARPGGELPAPEFGKDLGEEPEIAGLYVVDDDGTPWRVGYALGNETSDHVTERENYLYLAHSKLRYCSFGPVLLTGELPQKVEGTSRIWRDGKVLWEKPFLSGEAHMCHSLENLEYHHFKYQQFLGAGDVHVHFFGTATLSFADNISTRAGDVFEIESPIFGASLRNTVGAARAALAPGAVRVLD